MLALFWDEMCNRVLLPSICVCSIWFPLWVPLTYSCFVLTVPYSRSSPLRITVRSVTLPLPLTSPLSFTRLRCVWCEVYSYSLLCLFRLFFYFVLISSSSLLYFICFSLLLLMIDLVCVGAGKT